MSLFRVGASAIVALSLVGCGSYDRSPSLLSESEPSPPLSFDPCQDRHFLELRDTPPDEMSPDDRAYYVEFARLCAETEAARAQQDAIQQQSRGTALVLAMGAAGLVIYLLSKKGSD